MQGYAVALGEYSAHALKRGPGMRQRLGLAQAMIHRPRLAILAEPMSGLDPLGRRDVRMLIVDLAREGVTVFFSSHILSDVETLCDRVGVVSGGPLVAAGPVRELAAPRVQAVEVQCASVTREDVSNLGDIVSALRDDAGVFTFEVPHEEAANRAARMVVDKGGTIKAIVPVKESLEEVFARLQVHDGAPPQAPSAPASATGGAER